VQNRNENGFIVLFDNAEDDGDIRKFVALVSRISQLAQHERGTLAPTLEFFVPK